MQEVLGPHRTAEHMKTFGRVAVKCMTSPPKIEYITPEKVELGRMLYFDARLSKNHDVSCASENVSWTVSGISVGTAVTRKRPRRPGGTSRNLAQRTGRNSGTSFCY